MRGGSIGVGALAALAVVALAVAVPAPAQERPAVIVDGATPRLVAHPDGGWRVAVELANVTGAPLTLNSQPGDLGDERCRPTVPRTLPPARISTVAVRVPAVCRVTAGRFEFEIDAESLAGETVASIGFDAQEPPGATSEPRSAPATAIAILLALLAGAAALALLRRPSAR